MEFLLEESEGDPLTEAELNGVVDEIRVYRDDGNGYLDGGDALAGTYSEFSPVDGVVALPFADGDLNAAVDAAQDVFFFVKLTVKPRRTRRVSASSW